MEQLLVVLAAMMVQVPATLVTLLEAETLLLALSFQALHDALALAVAVTVAVAVIVEVFVVVITAQTGVAEAVITLQVLVTAYGEVSAWYVVQLLDVLAEPVVQDEVVPVMVMTLLPLPLSEPEFQFDQSSELALGV